MIKELFPHILVISASAGTGKTHNLSQRIAKYLLAERTEIPFNDLRNILAVTFTINASREMKERVLKWLKDLALGKDETFKLFESEKKEEYSKKAEGLVNKILTNYKDFQIKTIDSFLTSIFKASSIFFVNSPNFEVALNSKEYIETAFDLYLDELKDLGDDFFKVLEFINDNEPSFNFTPYKKIFDYVKNLYTKEKHFPKGFANLDREKEWLKKKEELNVLCKEIKGFIDENNLDNFLSKDGLKTMIADIESGDFESFFTRGEKKNPIKKDDVDKPWAKKIDYYWELLKKKRREAIDIYSENYFYPYLKVLKSFEKKIEFVKKSEEMVFIEDIPKIIYSKLEELNIPDIYIRLGSRLYHYFIDEFQDTSPIQWENLKPLIENSLASGGSLYVVGDTKQAIYGFRDTDYRIMKRLYDREETFLCVGDNHKTKNLDINFRSGEVILQYVKRVFNEIKEQEDYKGFKDSGLFDDWKVDVVKKDSGYVNAKIVYNEKDSDEIKEREEIINIINDCYKRGYSYCDITVLTQKNDDIVEISSWLNQADIPFLSYSSLDIRKRKVIVELFDLLRFLDSPKDNLAFSMFLLGEIFSKLADKETIRDFVFNNKKTSFLYKEFEKKFPNLWDNYFKEPFKLVGYLPTYELLCFLINVFQIKDNFESEAGAVAKLLEIVKDLEGRGKNSLKELLDFIETKEEDEYESSRIFELPVPQNYDGVKLMTVHKAKGLSAKVVIYLVYSSSYKRDSLKVYEEGDKAYVIKLNKNYRGLEDKYDAVMRKQKINDLNSFYVGITRAEDELYVIGVGEDKKESNDNKKERFIKSFPVDLIKEGEFGEKKIKERKSEVAQTGLRLKISRRLKIEEQGPSKLNIEEKRRGEYIHFILSEIYNLDDSVKLSELAKKYSIDYSEFKPEETARLVNDFLNSPTIKPFFDVDKSKVFLEKSLVDNTGIIRVDRLIISDDVIWIIDFKTGEIEDDYKKQLERYAKAVKDIYKKKVYCYILYIDKKEALKVYEC